LPFRENSVICIQETHLTNADINSLRCQWRGEIVFSPSNGARGGVAILYKKANFDEVTDSYFDADARICSFTAVKNDETYYFLSIYAPTEHANALQFYNRIEQLIEEQFQKNSMTRFIVSGDFNLFQLWNSFPIHWRTLAGRSRRWNTYVDPDYIKDEICTEVNKWVKIKNVDLKQLKKRLISRILKPKTVLDLNTKYNTNLEEHVNPFILCQKMSKNIPLRNVQYKILHNAYPTMKHLFHWRIKNSPNCTSCNMPETTMHALWECNIANQTIQNLQSTLSNISTGNRHVQISKEKFVYGIKSQPVTNMIFALIK
jgi:hypothetical protein